MPVPWLVFDFSAMYLLIPESFSWDSFYIQYSEIGSCSSADLFWISILRQIEAQLANFSALHGLSGAQMYVCSQLWIPPSSPLINTILENSRWYIKTNRNPHKIIPCRIIFVMKLFIHSLSEPLGLRFPFKRHDFIWFHLFNNYFNSIWFLFLQRKKKLL